MLWTNARVAWSVAAVSTTTAVLLALNQFYPGLLKPKQRGVDAAIQAVRSSLKDPESARFSNVYMAADGKYACGDVNAKNSMGGYVGATVFMLQVETGRVEFMPPDADPNQSTQEQIAALEKRVKFVKDVKALCGEPATS